MSSTGTTTLRSHSFVDGGATTSTGVVPPRNRATSSSGRTVAERPMRWAGSGRGGPGGGGGWGERGVEPLEAESEVGAALGAGYGVHLVHDDRLDLPQA